MITVKTPREIELMREVGRVVAGILNTVEKYVKPGVTTKELDQIAEDFVLSQGAKPAFKGYGFDKRNLFPATICLSIDDQVVHGIPGSRKLEEGQLLSVDVGAIKNGYYGDAAKTFAVGNVSDEKKKLMEVTEKALYIGIESAVAGNHVEDICHAVQEYVEGNGFFCGARSCRTRHWNEASRGSACSKLREKRKGTFVEKWNDNRDRTDGQRGII